MYFVTYYKNGVFCLLTINRIIELSKARGLKQAYLCSQLGLERSWLQNIKRHNSTISEERLTHIADILDTTVAYLKGETDDPAPAKEKSPSELDELLSDPLNKELFDKLAKLSAAKKKALLALIEDQETD